MKHIFIVDDDIHIGNMLEEVLQREGYKVSRAYSGTEALLVLSTQTPDLILLDLMLPGLNGEEVLPKIQGIPVIILSARSETDHKVQLLLDGACDYITKPFDAEILRSKINSLMKKRDDMKRYFSNSSAVSHDEENTLSTNPFMDAVVKNIEKHLDDSTFEAKVLADSLNMSLPTLYRKIKQYSDLSILELTRNIRLKKAAELLASQQYSVQEVAEMVGFNDTATFRKRFTEQYGVTPSQYGIPA